MGGPPEFWTSGGDWGEYYKGGADEGKGGGSWESFIAGGKGADGKEGAGAWGSYSAGGGAADAAEGAGAWGSYSAGGGAAADATEATPEDVDEADLAELMSFMKQGDAGVAPAASAPAAGQLPFSQPLPPGFEHGPNTGADAAPAGVAEGGSSHAAPPQMNGAAPRSGLVGEAMGKVVVDQADPTAPYLAATSWEELNLPKEILDGIFDMGFVRPSKIQEWALPIAIKGGNIIGQAQNGSGKTAAFALAMLLRSDAANRYPQAVCVSPTRELAIQNGDVISKLGKFSKLDVFMAIPQMDRPPRKVESPIIVGTPGKLSDLMKKRTIDARWGTILVMDEADHLMDTQDQMGAQVKQVRNNMPEDVQILLFSATWPDHVEKFARQIVPRANHIRVQKEDLTLNTITQTYVVVSGGYQNKARQLSDLYSALNVGQSIIFVSSRRSAWDLTKMMKEEGHTVSLIMGTQTTGPDQVDIEYRDRVMSEFRTGVTKVLISTDVLARGIDVPAVTLVVNFDMPGRHGEVDYETYMHRIGRTGRFGLRGVAVNFVGDTEVHMIGSIQNHYQCKIERLSGDVEEVEALLKDLR